MSDKNNLTPKELYDLRKGEKNQTKKKEQVQEKINSTPTKIRKYIFRVIVTVGVFIGIGLLFSLIPKLPPTVQENHSEDIPSAHILTTAMPDPIQRHMLEHADGAGISGIIIQYNCDDYECAPDLIQKLTALVQEYPENVYLAPNSYDGKIILTKLGKQETLDEFDEQTIRDFIK